jgi:hypothetical protein
MSDMLKVELVRLMAWQARALVWVGAVLILFCVQQAIDLLGYQGTWAAGALTAVFWIVVLPTVVLCLITLWFIFRTGQLAFGTGSGIVYLLLTVVLFWWPGLFVIPHMIRLDIKRLRGVGLDDDDLVGRGPKKPLPPTGPA